VAKKRDLLDSNYNPVAEQIRRYKESVTDPQPRPEPPLPPSSRDDAAHPRQPPSPPTRDATAMRTDAHPPPPISTLRPPSIRHAPEIARQPDLHQEPEEEAEAGPSPTPRSGSDALTTSMRTRVTREEHQHWTDVCLRITGKQNQFSALVRALLIILENSQDELEKKLPEIHRMRVPPRTDRLANSLYEYRLAELLYEAIEAAGGPRPPGVMRQKR
jgi:hypothetical protein